MPRKLTVLRDVLSQSRVPVLKLRKWHKNLHWDLRATAFDNKVHETWQKKVHAFVETKAQDYTAVHLDLLGKAEKLAANELRKFVEASYASDAIGLVRMNELNKLLESTIKLGRLVHGESTDKVDLGVDLSNLSVVELRELKRLQAKAKEGQSED